MPQYDVVAPGAQVTVGRAAKAKSKLKAEKVRAVAVTDIVIRAVRTAALGAKVFQSRGGQTDSDGFAVCQMLVPFRTVFFGAG